MPPSSPKLYESLVLSLAFSCPYGEEAVDCPMATIRKLPLALRIEEVLKMDCECQQGIYMSHRLCLAKREGKPIDTTRIGLRKTTKMLKKPKASN